MKNVLTHKGYYGSVEYCPTDNILYGKLLGVRGSYSYHADNVADLRAAFAESVNDYLMMCEEMGVDPQKPYKGGFNVRLTPEEHHRLAVYSNSRNQSLNASIREAIGLLTGNEA